MSEKETAIKAIEQIVNKETSAWNNKDVEMLLSLFHPDMVWPWPKHPYAHDQVPKIYHPEEVLVFHYSPIQ